MLAYLHPLWQIASLALAVWVLGVGLRMRRLRRRGRWVERTAAVDRHARGGLVFLGALAVGAAAGPITLGLVRDEPVFRSGHAFFAALTLAPLTWGGVLGWRLWRGGAGSRDLHALAMGVGLFLALVTVTFGLVLLP